ncbi:gliding motility lipoprotein GldH [Cyclobacterium amurskyense]|uniref:GldH n=1 Tax=Cyclobacterium amurskyense TaxID=320787 RepID=A0A0H4PH04_9BACT|nr:gliding motility lipoprotein GldH [Cyclobacterium amurskyense]AKP52133.1 GldH [Cyclobacterium amurskyense]
MKSKTAWKNSLVIVLFWVITACNNGRVYESFQDLETLKWVVSDTISFDIDSLDVNSKMSSILAIRYDDKYEYNNLYVRFLLRDSVDKVLMDSLLNIHLFDPKTGKPLGQGFGNRRIRYDTLPGGLIHAKSTFQFIQYMRKDTLAGIESIGLKINEGQ